MRRTRPERREITPDVRYQSVVVQSMIARIMRRGKKSTAASVMYDALDIVQEKTGKNPSRTARPGAEERWPDDGSPPTACGWRNLPGAYGSSFLPADDFGHALDYGCSKARAGKSFAEKLSGELLDASEQPGRSRPQTRRDAQDGRS